MVIMVGKNITEGTQIFDIYRLGGVYDGVYTGSQGVLLTLDAGDWVWSPLDQNMVAQLSQNPITRFTGFLVYTT